MLCDINRIEYNAILDYYETEMDNIVEKLWSNDISIIDEQYYKEQYKKVKEKLIEWHNLNFN